jgi:hypothetical protein
MMTQASIPPPKLCVAASPNLELMLVVAMLAAPTPSPGHYGTLDHPIARAARAWFTPYSSHPAVATVRQLFYVEGDHGSGFACDALISFALRRNAPPDLTARYPYSASVLARAHGERLALDRLAEQLVDFYHTSRFASFWEEQASAYGVTEQQVTAHVKAGWDGEDVVATMETYFGQEHTSYVLIPTPMERPRGGTMETVGEEDSHILACFDSTVDREWVLYLLYHECGHSFVNPLAERFRPYVQQYETLYAPIREAMSPWGYTHWTVALNEHILRAQNCRLQRRLLGDTAAEACLSTEQVQGFRYIRALDEKLAEYEDRRDAYPTLSDFYPTLLTALEPFKS